MRLIRIALAVLVAAPVPALAQKKNESRAAKAPAAAVASAATASPALPSFSGPSSSTIANPTVSSSSQGSEERQQLDKLSSLNQIDQQKTVSRLRPLNDEREDVVARYNLLYEKQKLEFAPLEAELRRLQLESSLASEKAKKEQQSLAQQRDALRVQNELSREKIAAEQAKADLDKLKMDLAMRELDFQSRKLRAESELAESRTVGLKVDLDLREKKEKWKSQANREPEYDKEPFHDGVLTVSDRRIALNGPIVYGTADYVSDRIHYWNNKSEELPIFLVIDRSPGGSVMEGYRILKAMQGSKAPVHVVVKSYAASMAAVIATLAEHSYAYPNAIILHHQISSTIGGNLTQQKQQLDVLHDWDRRLREPVAKKMGVSLDKFTKQMYEHNVDGDWEEFADEAVRLHWIGRVVSEVKETGVLKQPDDKSDEKPRLAFGLAEESGVKGERYVRLPALQPFDAYFMYDHDGYYR
jgi:ATP-dependent Clp protease protease subunit